MAEVPLWIPSPERIATSRIMSLIAEVNRRHRLDLKTYRDLHAWSVTQHGAFWELVWDFGGVIGDKGARLLVDPDKMPGAKFFSDARLNFAENLLRRADDSAAIIFRGEDKAGGELAWAQLQMLVSRLQQAMKASCVGDRVAAMLPNITGIETNGLVQTHRAPSPGRCRSPRPLRDLLDLLAVIEEDRRFAREPRGETTFRAPAQGKSRRSRCATWCTGGR